MMAPGTMLRWVGWAAMAALLAGSSHAQAPEEQEVKAAFVLNMIRFTTWPNSYAPNSYAPNSSAPKGPGAGSELVVCALGRSDFANAVQRAVSSKTVQNRDVGFRVEREHLAERCSVLVVDASEYTGAAVALRAVADAPVLTIGNGAGMVDLGGMFELVVEDRRVRFDANLNAIRRGGLQVNAYLLQLSRRVKK